MSSKDKAQTPLLPSSSTTSRSGSNARRTSNTKKSTNSSSSLLLSSSHTKQQTSQSMSSSTTSARAKKGKDTDRAKLSSASSESRKSATTKPIKDETIVIEPRNRQLGAKATTQFQNRNALGQKLSQKKPGPSLSSSSSLSLRSTRGMNEESSSSSQEMTITSPNSDHGSAVARQERSTERSLTLEQETDIDRSFENQATDDDESATLLESSSGGNSMLNNKRPALISCASSEHSLIESQQRARHHHLPDGWEEHTDKEGVYYWHVPTGVIQRTKPTEDVINQIQIRDEQLVLYHDDEEINQTSAAAVRPSRTSSEEDDYTLESGAALTLADESTLSDAISFVVYPLGCCEFDETQLISANSTRAIQKCILRLSNLTNNDDEQCTCWGLDQTQPILMRLLDDHIQFIDISTQTLLRSQPIQTIKTWAVDDDNNFAFVVEDNSEVSSTTFTGESGQLDSVDYALLTGPNFMCYVFSSMDDDDMSLKVATKLNKEINRYRMQMSNRISKCTRLQQMVNSKPLSARLVASNKKHQPPVVVGADNDQTDADEDLEDENGGGGDDEDDDLAESSEMSLNVRYIGKVQVPRPMGIDVLNVAIDKCLADASKAQMDRLLDRNVASTSTSTSAAQLATSFDGQLLEISSPLTEAKLHVSPSSVIVENEQTGEIIVECRIRYLTFMGISRRDIRWCGFIMQNTTNQTFVAHCFECHPTAGHVCEAIQTSCSRMYEKMVKRQKMKQQVDDVTSIMPKSSKIRDTLAKTLSKIKLTPIL